jgi:hypothetical protein
MKNAPQPATEQRLANLAALRRSFEEMVANRKPPTTPKVNPVPIQGPVLAVKGK